jgi:hypothetical protein
VSIYDDLDSIAKNASFLSNYIYMVRNMDVKEVKRIMLEITNTVRVCDAWVSELKEDDGSGVQQITT